MSGTLSGTSAGIQNISTALLPEEGSRILSGTYSWAGTSSTYNEDLGQYVATGDLTTIQSVWVDNSLCAGAVVLLIGGTNQRITVPGLSIACYPVFLGNSGFVRIRGCESNGEGSIPNGYNDNLTTVTWCNVPVSPFVVPMSLGSQQLFSRTGVNVGDGSSLPILATYPTDLRFIYTQLSLQVLFTIPPTSAGNLTATLQDNGVSIAKFYIYFNAADTSSKNVLLTNQMLLQRFPGSILQWIISGFPTGAANAQLFANTNAVILPVAGISF